ncbi:uncharacterized histidine-rich protein DDB_G0274557-like [Penaeus japonicus]|uniref:uncharacterized histidine-rich protein DDB_G0274557-like n=1 Tax=Penaeus japonicus TaxID=27405 RepID=UPI001C7148E6|nr:uncharacterized histidine-rich protein DDB_G0274557-like [Penaeus japonicus]
MYTPSTHTHTHTHYSYLLPNHTLYPCPNPHPLPTPTPSTHAQTHTLYPYLNPHPLPMPKPTPRYPCPNPHPLPMPKPTPSTHTHTFSSDAHCFHFALMVIHYVQMQGWNTTYGPLLQIHGPFIKATSISTWAPCSFALVQAQPGSPSVFIAVHL